MQAEKDLKAAKEALNEAVKRLANIVIARCSGWDDLPADYLATLRESLATLVKVRDAVDA